MLIARTMGHPGLVETQLRSVEVTVAHMALHHLSLRRRLRVRVEQTIRKCMSSRNSDSLTNITDGSRTETRCAAIRQPQQRSLRHQTTVSFALGLLAFQALHPSRLRDQQSLLTAYPS
jgi:hypothetical protein